MTVHAVSNPFVSGREPADLYDRATGYGIVRLSRNTREIKIECWPRWADPSQSGAEQYLGWPVRLRQLDNGLAHPKAYLPRLNFHGLNAPVVQVIDEADREIVYTLRVSGPSFRPPVRKPGTYTIKVGELGTPRVRVLEHVAAEPECDGTIDVGF
jgi:hypothetical protein